jgi:tetratricopeptide (TPR) repeat protein
VIPDQRIAALLAICIVLVIGCADPVADLEPPPAKLPQPADPEVSRRLRLGVEQLRRFLPESARAEFEFCARVAPDEPELLFQQARLELMPGGAGSAAAAALLKRILEANPDGVKVRRLLYEIELRGNPAAAPAQREAIERAYGQVGLFEMATHEAYPAGGEGFHLRFVDEQARMSYLGDYRSLKAALMQLEKRGGFAPSEALPVIERSLLRFPDLAAVRLAYAKKLLSGIRVNYTDRPDLPPMSSTLILDIAQSQFERLFDQLNPRSPMAQETLYRLGHVALLMGDYDESIAYLDIQLAMTETPEQARPFLLGQRGLVRYKQGRHAEAIELLDRAVDGLPPLSQEALSFQWILRLVHEAAQTPPGSRRNALRLRPDLRRPPRPAPFDFEDLAPRYGINKRDGVGASAWADYDDDGDFDLFVTGADSFGALFRNDGETFTDVSREAGLFHVHSGFSATFSDYDGDGRPDLHIGRDGWNGPMRNSLYRNEGNGTFVELTERAGLEDPGSSFVCAWSDVDRDGDVDLMIANGVTGGGDTNRLYRNDGDGSFTDVTERAGLSERSGIQTIGLTFGDYDSDGWPDLFVSGIGIRNRLYRNRGDGTFEEVAERAGVAGKDDISGGYVAFFLDYDNDLDLDILKTVLAPWRDVLLGLSEHFDALPVSKRQGMLRDCPKLFRNDGDGTFTEVGEQAGFTHPIGIMGAGVADVDNDGYLDVYFATGDPAIERMEPDRFFHNNGDGTFSDVTFVTGLGNIGKGHGVTFVDIDGDGDLEIYVPEGGFVHSDAWPNVFYFNRIDSGNHWLHVDLEGSESNLEGLDTKLIVHAGELQILREVHNGVGFGSSDSPTMELGLGTAQQIDRLEVHWPSGQVQTFDDVPIDRRIFLREGEHWVARDAG